MKKILLFFAATLLVSVASAQTSSAIQGASVSKFEATQMTNNGNMFVVPLVSELKVMKNTPTDYTMQGSIIIPDMRQKEDEDKYMTRLENYIKTKIEELKAQALFEFIDHERASLIVSPIYSVTTVSSNANKMNIEVKIKGYPAVYTNFRNLQAADSTLIKLDGRIVEHKPKEMIINNKKIETTEQIEEVKRN
ncbi:MAG: hypothetical protein IJ834_03845 [Paludibacteraceae bacterium]|nr:hypothetical protein [Paludibacteraceae bacterium]